MTKAPLFACVALLVQQAWVQSRHAAPPALVGGENPLACERKTAFAAETRSDSVTWIQVPTDSGVVRAAIAMPKGTGPFPAIIILHGTHGFAEEYVELARRFARNGIVGVAACWFSGRRGVGVRFITPIDCPAAPPLVEATGANRFRTARQTIGALVRSVTALPNVRAGRVAIFGHSRGAGAALDYTLTHPGNVQAAILNSGGYPPEISKKAVEVAVPVLLLHGVADGPADGGSEFTSIAMARQFEAALRAAHKKVEVKFYDTGGHNGLFSDSTQFEHTVQRACNFLRDNLSK